MMFGPFDVDQPQAEIDLPAERSTGFGDDETQKLLAEASRTWDVLSSDLKSDWKRR
jgi:hypothetical protein